ncbi:MAG: hypothetical protein F6K58_14175 [Symploca sp. SIO2E9]|nr:hypothetical protein [Symploca sp. SIO2E9]
MLKTTLRFIKLAAIAFLMAITLMLNSIQVSYAAEPVIGSIDSSIDISDQVEMKPKLQQQDLDSLSHPNSSANTKTQNLETPMFSVNKQNPQKQFKGGICTQGGCSSPEEFWDEEACMCKRRPI